MTLNRAVNAKTPRGKGAKGREMGKGTAEYAEYAETEGGKTGSGFATKRHKRTQEEILSFSFRGSSCLLVVFRCFQWDGYFPARRAKENSPPVSTVGKLAGG